jgi:glycosyltransferase involved in cell wall biosynthesis
MEAMASALPAVGLLSEGACDLVEDGVTGLLLNAHRLNEEEQIEGYRQRLQRLVDDQQTRREMSRAALKSARRGPRRWSALYAAIKR